MSQELLVVKDLHTTFATAGGDLPAVDGISFTLGENETLGIVGESGSGKTVLARTIMGLQAIRNATVTGSVKINGSEVVGTSEEDKRKIWGTEVSMIFQDPMTSLNPVMRIGKQVDETLRVLLGMSKEDAKKRAIELLEMVGIPSPEERYEAFPSELSGGMRQRVVIATALACSPKLVLADEPTTGLDVTIQAQILNLLDELKEKMQMSVILITHDLGVIAETCDEVVVMYGGRVVERASAEELFAHPLHAYTRGLLHSIPTLEKPPKSILSTIPGMVASLAEHVHGCRFCQRMGRSSNITRDRPGFAEVSPGHWVETCPECYKP